MNILTFDEIEKIVRDLLAKYNAESAVLFGSYARGEASGDSDLDIVIYGGKNFKLSNIFLLAEDLRNITGKDADVFEIREVNAESLFYENIINEGIKIA